MITIQNTGISPTAALEICISFSDINEQCSLVRWAVTDEF